MKPPHPPDHPETGGGAPQVSGLQDRPLERLLVVDDERVVLLGMGHYFRTKGYDVDCAREREEAEALLVHHEYCCVIVDLRMSAAHGAEGLEIVALARERCPRAGIVVLTAYGSAATEIEAKARGADLFLNKPQPLGDLAEDVTALLRRKRA